MGRLRVAIVGCGLRAEAHVRALEESDDYRLVAACDLDETRLREAAARYGIQDIYDDVARMVESVRPELVDVVTSPDGRADVVEAAVAGGATHVLIEKPIGLRPSEAERLRRLGRSVFIAVNTQYQWMPHWQRIWPQVAAGALGEVSTILCSTRANILEQARTSVTSP
jgi:D-apiose dehydrogenase